MPRRKSCTIMYVPAVKAHLRTIDAKYHSLIHAKVAEQLEFEPGVETNNRKPLRQPAPYDAGWEIRFDPDNCFRVLYDILEDEQTVEILAIGEKERGRLMFGGEDVGS